MARREDPDTSRDQIFGTGLADDGTPNALMTHIRFRSLSDPESLREFAKNLREGIYITARDGRILDANRAFVEMLGLSALDDLADRHVSNLFIDPTRRIDLMALLDRDGSVREFEIALRRPDGKTLTVLDTCYLIKDTETGEDFIHGILVDITGRKHLEAKLLEMSTHDALTGALNRRYLMDLEELFTRDADAACGCIFVDIDHFKLYNDRWGHHEGDEVLKRMARFLMRYVRTEEAVLRIGGDEFVVILNNADADQTRLVADRLRAEALEHAPVPFSLGWAARGRGESLQTVLDRADGGMMAVRVDKRKTDPRQQRVLRR
jgi:diguanylate cyclase (GGDEF)-like protein/PAS domain S-box-containing protein